MNHYIYEVALTASPQQDAELRARLECARQAYNAAVTIGRRRGQKYIDAVNVCRARKAEYPKRSDHGIGRYWAGYWAGPQDAKITRSWIGERICAAVTLSTVERVEKTVTEWIEGALYDRAKRTRKRPNYKRSGELASVDSRSGEGITIEGACVRWACRAKSARIRELLLPIRWDQYDPYLKHLALNKVSGVRIIARTYGLKRRWRAQLTIKGDPPVLPHRTMGAGIIGLDLGPSAIAIVDPSTVTMEDMQSKPARLCDAIMLKAAALRRYQRRMDRQRRANNPGCFDDRGRAIRGKRPRNVSKRQRVTRCYSADVQRRLAAHRKCLHGAMGNDIVRAANRVQTEDITYTSWQRTFGRSIGARAPGMFVERLAEKLKRRGGELVRLPTRTLCLSQLCQCGAIKKKSRDNRRHECDCGVTANRDKYSALLAACVSGSRVDVDQVNAIWSRLLTAARATSTLHNAALVPRPHPEGTGIYLHRPPTDSERYGDAHDGMRPVAAIPTCREPALAPNHSDAPSDV